MNRNEFKTSSFCVRLKELRLEKGITQKALANWLGVSVAKFSKLERLIDCADLVLLGKLSCYFDARIQFIQGISNVRKVPIDIPYSQLDKYIAAKEKELAQKNKV